VLEQLMPYFERIAVPKDHVLWTQGDAADGLYVIGAGVLRATYHFAEHTSVIEESMVPGTLAGELSGLAGLARNATVVAERPAVLWRLGVDALRRLETERPELARTFTALVLKGACTVRRNGSDTQRLMSTFDFLAAKLDFDILLSALATRQ
jgi:sulfate permease, SulP family